MERQREQSQECIRIVFDENRHLIWRHGPAILPPVPRLAAARLVVAHAHGVVHGLWDLNVHLLVSLVRPH